jgi:hypothetical protein
MCLDIWLDYRCNGVEERNTEWNVVERLNVDPLKVDIVSFDNFPLGD